LLELAVVIVILAAIAVVSAPRFLSIADDAREATSRALFDNFRAGAEIYQGACLARGGDVTELQGKNTSNFNIDGIYSNFSGSCYPVRNSNAEERRDINNA
ncbi:type II secretion system protein, partial [Vibrio breoganii]